MSGLLTGRELSRRFYAEVVAPLVGPVPHAAALLGEGSEVLGFDDAVSADHDFGPRVQVFLPAGVDPAPVHSALARLPECFAGFPVAFADTDRHGGRPHHQVEVTTAEEFFTGRLGVDPAAAMDLADWLAAPTQVLATLVDGVVFTDPLGLLEPRRAALRWYPTDVWRYVLAAGWLRVSQEEAFVGRTGAVGDELGSAVLAARLARDLMRLAFLVERRWAPYSKWLGTAFARLPVATRVGPLLERALRAPGWREREAALCSAARELAMATNRLGIAAQVDPEPRRYYTRDIHVLGADRLTNALVAAITDPRVRAVVDGQGQRADGTVGSLPGAIDQVVDSVEVLTHRDRRRRFADLGLPDMP